MFRGSPQLQGLQAAYPIERQMMRASAQLRRERGRTRKACRRKSRQAQRCGAERRREGDAACDASYQPRDGGGLRPYFSIL